MGWGKSHFQMLTLPTTGLQASDFTSWSFSFPSPCLALHLQGPGAAGRHSCAARTHLCGEQLKIRRVHALVETAVLQIHQEAAGTRGQAPGRPGQGEKESTDQTPLLPLSSSLGGRQLGFSPFLGRATSLGLTWMGALEFRCPQPTPFRNT